MPAKRKYLLNEQELKHEALYRKFSCISQYQPLVLLLGLSMLSCGVLIILFFALQLSAEEHCAFVSVVSCSLCVFLAVFVLVCTETLTQRWRRLLGLVVWATHLTMGFTFIFSGPLILPWDQVPFFLFIIFTVYTMLPFQMCYAVVLSVISSLSHIMVLTLRLTVFNIQDPSPFLANQLLSNAVVFLCGSVVGAFHKVLMERTLRQTFQDTLRCLGIRMKLEIEKRQQENLLQSVLPVYISMKMKLAIMERLQDCKDKEEQQRLVKDNNFHSLYVKRHENVRQWVKSEEISSLAVWFPKKELEKQYRAIDLPMFKHYIGCATFIFFCIFVVQMFVTKDSKMLGIWFGVLACVLLLTLGICFAGHLQRLFPEKLSSCQWLPAVSEAVVRRPCVRLPLVTITTAVIIILAVFNLCFIQTKSPCDINGNPDLIRWNNSSEQHLDSLFYLPYSVFSCILALIACGVFLRVSFELKVVFLTLASTAYYIIILSSKADLFSCYERMLYNQLNKNSTEDSGTILRALGLVKHPEVMSCIYITLFLVTMLIISQQNESCFRQDFLLKNKNRTEQDEIETRENLNRLLLENVLPAHVAALFVGENKKNEDLYYKSYDCVCVMFASVPDFKEFYTECDINKEGLECLRLLNEIIADFDELLSKPKFSGVEKIKTIGSTYMAAAGLSGTPGQEKNQDRDRQQAQIGNMVEFAIALIGKLDGINRHSFNSFRLRVGINHGPVIAGVIGARKPQYDIWGNTVNVASRMESTGELGQDSGHRGDVGRAPEAGLLL
ncbi:hypothetical protein J4Q44_G00351960 [Coregonus suidteri]|uniref:adenylate cyclase n=1 Tax=Coregonus suidteri TaxID=861788 RepID=A0AAN8QC64_9TELE